MQHIIDKLEAEYPRGVELGYVDYNSDLEDSKETVSLLLAGKIDEFTDTIWEWYRNDDYNYIETIIDEVFPEELTDEEKEVVRDWCYGNDTFNPIPQLLRNTRGIPVRLMLRSNYEFIERDFKDSEAFKDAKKKLKGKMPMKELTEGVRSEFAELCSDYGNLCFASTIDLQQIYNNGGLKKIQVLKGTQRGLHNSWIGTCGLIENVVNKSFTINLDKQESNYDYWDLVLDDDDGYGIDSVCGMTRDFWERGGFIAVK